MCLNPDRHYSSFSFLHAFKDEDAAKLHRPHSGTVNINEISTFTYLSSLLQLRLTHVSMQRYIFVFRVDQPAQHTIGPGKCPLNSLSNITNLQNVNASRRAYGPGCDTKKTSWPRRYFCNMKRR